MLFRHDGNSMEWDLQVFHLVFAVAVVLLADLNTSTCTGLCRCKALYIQFGDAYFPEMPYYSGRFEAVGDGALPTRHSGRTVFEDESGSVRLRYSRGNKAWLIEQNIDKSDPEYPGFMFKSSETEAFDIAAVSDLTWFANTEAGEVPVDWLYLTCDECIVSRCNQAHGSCQDDRCVCNPGRMGQYCEAEEPECSFMGLDLRTKSAVANIPGGYFFYQHEFQDLDVLLSALLPNATLRFFGRKIYIPFSFGLSVTDESIANWIAFTGRRWVIFGAEAADVGTLNATHFAEFLNDTYFLTATEGLDYLAETEGYRPLYFSSPVDFGTTSYGYDPTKVTWVFAEPLEENSLSELAPDSIFGFGPKEDDPVPAQFLCSDCNQHLNCANGGECNTEWGYCMCLPFHRYGRLPQHPIVLNPISRSPSYLLQILR